MPKAILFVTSAPASPEREDEYNDWYTNVHIPDILALDGFVSATRYKTANPPEGTPAYAAIYELDADDPAAAVAGIGAAVRDGKVRMSDAISRDTHPFMVVYEEIS